MSYKNADNIMLQSVQINWIPIGTINATTGAADAALGATERTVGDVEDLTNAIVFALSPGLNIAMLRASMAANNDDCVFDVYLCKMRGETNADLVRVCTVTGIAGAQARSDGGYYLDTMTVTNDNWFTDVKKCTPAADHVHMIGFDALGFDTIVIHGHTTVDSLLTVELTGV